MRRFLEFTNWSVENERIHIDPYEVSSMREYKDRPDGRNDLTELTMKSGEKYVVHGHVAKQINNHGNEQGEMVSNVQKTQNEQLERITETVQQATERGFKS